MSSGIRVVRSALPLQRKSLVRFALTEELTTSDASATADIVEQFGQGADAGVEEGITVLNYLTSASGVYRWEGASGAIGLALWHQGNEFVIVDLEC